MAIRPLFIFVLAFLSHSFAAPTTRFSIKPFNPTTIPPPSSTSASTGTPTLDATSVPTTTSTTQEPGNVPLTRFSFNFFSIPTLPPRPLTKYCRQVHTLPSLCVYPPTFKHAGRDFCKFRMCAPKYVEADMCPSDPDLAAKAKCYVEKITRQVYKCDNIFKKARTDPLGCKLGTPGCKEVEYCSCLKVSEDKTNQLKFIRSVTPKCKPM